MQSFDFFKNLFNILLADSNFFTLYLFTLFFAAYISKINDSFFAFLETLLDIWKIWSLF